MSKWSEANERLTDRKLRTIFGVKTAKNNQTDHKPGTEKLVNRTVRINGEDKQRTAVVPKTRSKYWPKSGESIGPAKPGRNTGKGTKE